MKAEETTLARLVRGEMQFQVPIYQRTYRWTTNDHLAQLWNDITDQADLIASGDASESRATHFLGSVVLAPVPANDATCPRWLVVDGQQRLTSLSMALTAYRDHRAVDDPRIKDRIDDQYLINKYREGDLHLRLLPTLADRASYNAAIRGTDEMRNDAIGAAYDFFLKKLRSVEDRDHLDRIEQAITTRLSLVVITADKDDNVHRIFESLNNRGLKLSQADLLRNFLFMRLPNRSEHVYATQWLPMQNSLENEDLERLMWLQLVLDGEDRVRQQDMYAAQHRRLDGGEAPVEAYVTELRRRSRHLIRIIDPGGEPNHRVRDYLKRLLRWQGAVTHPAVMLLLDRQEKELIDDEELVQALAVIESFLVRRLICQIPTNNLNRIFQSLPSQLPADKGTLEGLRWVLSGERHFWPSDAELQDAIRTKQFYLRGSWDQKYLILQRLEESIGHSEPVDFERAQLTIEHILPQEPGSDWLEVLAEEAGPDETPEELHVRIVHTLGNLTLTADNSRLSNHPFQRKLDLLKGSHLEMNKRIAATDRWGAAEIKARADELADRAIKLWTAPDAGGHQVRQYRDWSPLKQALAAMPHGTWTTYGDLAALLGSAPQAVGTYLTTTVGVVNAHRVLNVSGRVAEGFRWPDGSDRDVFEVLAADGVKFDGRRVADKEQRLSVDDLAALAGIDDSETSRSAVPVPTVAMTPAERQARFRTQLAEANPEQIVDAVEGVLHWWAMQGGRIEFGAEPTHTSCFPVLDRPGAATIRPFTLYPAHQNGGAIEIAFQHMATQSPFDDEAKREEFRILLNKIPRVEIAASRINMRPSFPLSVLSDPAAIEAVHEAITWFAEIGRHINES